MFSLKICCHTVVFLWLIALFNMAAHAGDHERPFRLFMVLWNGATDLEKGFLSYLKHKKVPVEIMTRNCEGERAKCHAFIPEIRAFKPDLIYTWGTPACEEIAGKWDQPKKNYIWDIPIVSLIVTNPVTSKIIKDLDHPGRNVTGVNHVAPLETQLKTILTYKRSTKVIVAIYSADETNAVLQVGALKDLAKTRHIAVHALPLPLKGKKSDSDAIPDLVARAYALQADFIYMPTDTFLSLHADRLIEAANLYKIPTFSPTESMYWKGKPMLGVFCSFINVGTFGGQKAYDILVKKKNPATIPHEKLPRYSVVISKPTYEKVGLTPPVSLLKFAEILR